MFRGASQQVDASKTHKGLLGLQATLGEKVSHLENEWLHNFFGETVDLDLLYHSTKYHGDWVAGVGDLGSLSSATMEERESKSQLLPGEEALLL